MTAAVEDTGTVSPEDYDGKRVLIKLVDFDEAFEATVEAGSDMGYIIKPKGKGGVQLVKSDQVEKIELAPASETTLKPRRLNKVGLDTVKRHLVDRHGYKLSEINKLPTEDALTFHDSLEHDDLSHFHADPPEKKEKGEKEGADVPAAATNGDAGTSDDEDEEPTVDELDNHAYEDEDDEEPNPLWDV